MIMLLLTNGDALVVSVKLNEHHKVIDVDNPSKMVYRWCFDKVSDADVVFTVLETTSGPTTLVVALSRLCYS